MIYQPRRNGDACYSKTLPVLLILSNGLSMRRAIKVLIQVRNRRRFAIVAGWDDSVDPTYRYAPVGYYEGNTINVN